MPPHSGKPGGLVEIVPAADDTLEGLGEVGEDVDALGLGGLDERVADREDLRGLGVAGVDPVGPSDRLRAQVSLGEVVAVGAFFHVDG